MLDPARALCSPPPISCPTLAGPRPSRVAISCIHVASPFPAGPPKHEDDLIKPRTKEHFACSAPRREAGVKRVVLTSSFAAIGYGHKITDKHPSRRRTGPTPNGGDVTHYVKSKTLAERAAWDFISREGGDLELSVVNPVGVFGPVLGPDYSTSILFVQRLMDGEMPGCPRLSIGVVDVRDVADLHLRAMTNPAARGERFLAVAGDFMTIQEIAYALKKRMGNLGARLPTRLLPDWMVRLVSLFDKSVALIVPELGKTKNASNEKARRMLGWSPRTPEDAVVATAESLVRLGLLGTGRKAG